MVQVKREGIYGAGESLVQMKRVGVYGPVGHVAMSSKNWFGPVKGYSLLVQMTSRNLSISVEYVNVL